MKNMIYGPERKLIHNQGYMYTMPYLKMLYGVFRKKKCRDKNFETCYTYKSDIMI